MLDLRILKFKKCAYKIDREQQEKVSASDKTYLQLTTRREICAGLITGMEEVRMGAYCVDNIPQSVNKM